MRDAAHLNIENVRNRGDDLIEPFTAWIQVLKMKRLIVYFQNAGVV